MNYSANVGIMDSHPPPPKKRRKWRTNLVTFLAYIRASTSVGGNSYIIEKTSIFTHFISKLLYISASKVLYNHVYLSTSYSNCVYIHGYCISCIQYFNNFWFARFFSLSSSSAQQTIPHHVLSSSETHSHRHKIKNQLQT